MTTRSDDELVVPHFRDALWRELAELHATQAPGDGDGDGGRRRAGRADRADLSGPSRGRTRRRLLVATAVVALGGAATGLVLVGGRDEPGTVTVPADQATTTSTLAEVPRPLGLVVTEHRSAAGHVARSWKDERTGLWRNLTFDTDGSPSSDSGYHSRTQVGDEVVIGSRQVDHCMRTYRDEELRLPIETVRDAMPENVRAGGIPDTEFEDGTLVDEGTEVVDGRELLRYRDEANDSVVWLDPETRELVRRSYTDGEAGEQTTTYEYLAPTPENMAQLAPVIPPGYTDALADGGEEVATMTSEEVAAARAEAGCED